MTQKKTNSCFTLCLYNYITEVNFHFTFAAQNYLFVHRIWYKLKGNPKGHFLRMIESMRSKSCYSKAKSINYLSKSWHWQQQCCLTSLFYLKSVACFPFCWVGSQSLYITLKKFNKIPWRLWMYHQSVCYFAKKWPAVQCSDIAVARNFDDINSEPVRK